jgi:ABC-2 type transport system ATP-binding protein
MLPELAAVPGRIEAHRLWKRFRTDPLPGLLGQAARLRHGGTKWRWALRDISLMIQPGESVGIVGVNGSGKSTLLKMLTGTMVPTVGDLAVGGKVGALIELQAGLHPELSGRENALAYGTLLGLTRKQARDSLDDVLTFAGIEDAVDRQVKFYSTGMRLRLGFAIAAQLGAPVLLVDEVLAVADAEFQDTATRRLKDLRAEGTTLVVVSHDLSVIDGLCDRTVWLDDGVVADDGTTAGVLDAYRAARDPAG